jgi:transcription antitermination protein NusB
MSSRHRSRQRALQILYQWDIRRQPVDEAIAAFYETLYSEEDPDPPPVDEFMEALVRGTAANAKEIDRRIERKSAHWRIERMPVVDRNVLRLAIFEMTGLETPPAVVIDEALELARHFSSDESVSFVNGVLDAVHKDVADG